MHGKLEGQRRKKAQWGAPHVPIVPKEGVPAAVPRASRWLVQEAPPIQGRASSTGREMNLTEARRQETEARPPSVLQILEASTSYPFGAVTPTLPSSPKLTHRVAGTDRCDRDGKLSRRLRWLQSDPGVGRPLIAWALNRFLKPSAEFRAAMKAAPDAVHCHSALSAGRYLQGRDLGGLPLFVSPTGGDLGRALHSTNWAWLLDQVFERADRVVLPGERSSRLAIELGCASDKIFRMPQAVDTVRLGQDLAQHGARPPGAPRRLFTCGPLVERHGLSILLEAFARARDIDTEATLRLAGEGPLLGAIEAQASCLGISENVELLGRLTPALITEELARADVFLAPWIPAADGDREVGLPSGLRLALACGLPTIATRHGDFAETLVDGENSWLVDEHDIDQLTETLRAVLSGQADGKAKALGKAARATAESHLAVADWVQAFEELYSQPQTAPTPALETA